MKQQIRGVMVTYYVNTWEVRLINNLGHYCPDCRWLVTVTRRGRTGKRPTQSDEEILEEMAEVKSHIVDRFDPDDWPTGYEMILERVEFLYHKTIGEGVNEVKFAIATQG